MRHNHHLFAKSYLLVAGGERSAYGCGTRQAHIDYVREHGQPVMRQGQLWYELRARHILPADRWLYRHALGMRVPAEEEV